VQGGPGSAKGLGVGLAVALQLMELHRGTIRVESPGPGGGTTFIVSIPTAHLPVSNFVPPSRNHVH
jgi:signal transduction histidine kinase